MLKLTSHIFALPEFEALHQQTMQHLEVKIRGTYGSFNAFIALFLHQTFESPLLVIAPDNESAEKLSDDLQILAPPHHTAYLPADEVVPFDRGLFTPSLYSQRLHALTDILEGKSKILVVSPQALIRRVEPPQSLKQNLLHLKVGEDFERDLLIEWLIEGGYERRQTIEEIGQFSVRGGIVDVFSFEADVPYRIEYFGDTIESIREFDILSQLSLRQLEHIRLLSKTPPSQGTATLFDYFPSNTLVLWLDHEAGQQAIMRWWEDIAARFPSVKEEFPISTPEERYMPIDELSKLLQPFRRVISGRLGPRETYSVHFRVNPAPEFKGNIKLFAHHLEERLTPPDGSAPWKLYFLHDTKTARERMEELLEAEMGISPPLLYLDGELHSGFSLPDHRLEVFAEHEIFNRLRMRRRKKRLRVSGSLLRNINHLNYGDYVVHVDYGIGQYAGTERLKVAGREKEVVKLVYADNDILYVNLDKLNRVQKYISEEGVTPNLTKLGSAEWDRVKKRTRQAVQKIAKELVALYAARMAQQGHAFSPDTLWQKELEAAFPYEDTPDQAKATEAVKQDMENPRPMDRLICGDVGYGKTEVAVRAAFKAVMDGKQVAVLVPTTILAQQHYHTFRERMIMFPVQIEMLSRFRTPSQQKQILKKLQAGEIDIIIGTHRLLSKDVHFKDLGLLIVDEEQRFGVTHKERLKQLKVTVDTLTLTATPIPRTLHMALMGARDLSTIDTPPSNRHPIITEITTWDTQLIYKAITYELNRGGQVFFVHNRVQTIEGVASMLRNIVPKARIKVAHGQMKERQLETIMNEFYHKEFDVLVATMIIENGLDIPNVNTIIIDRADQFGLAQLYQLRGRVGRSDRQAYAYLIVPPQERLNETALKRLYAIEEFDDLGSGLKIAMRDLEIRGAGNLLGHQQSGFINAVGYDLYQKILREAVENLQEETLPEEIIHSRMPTVDAAVDVDVDTYLPDEYIQAPNEKVVIYHRLLHAPDLSTIDALVRELRDRFGPLPEEARALVEMVKIKKLASQRFVKQVRLKGNKLILIFDEKAVEKDQFVQEELPRYINQQLAKLHFVQDKTMRAVVEIKGQTPLERVEFARKFLHNL